MENDNKALDHFKDWSNYLLITTVAALGWVAGAEIVWCSPWCRLACLWLLALSVVFAMLTLALVPLVAEQRRRGQSIYEVNAEFWLCGKRNRKLKSFCFGQHLLFLAGVLIFAYGTGWRP